MSPDASIDVLIVSRTMDLVVPCLEHLRRQTVPHLVYLADNGSADRTASVVSERFSEVDVTAFVENRGFGRAMNWLASRGSGEFIVLVNDDMNVEPRFLERLVAPFADPTIGMSAGLTLQPGGGEIVDGFGIELDCTLLAYNRLRHRSPRATPGTLLGPSGGAAAYRRTAWQAAGGFDPRLYVYAEDQDLALRLRIAGWKAGSARDARGVHLGGATAGRDSEFQRHHAGFGRGFILRRYGVLRTRHAPRALLLEALTVARGVAATGTLVTLHARVAGWRAAGHTPRLAIPSDAVDDRISFRESLRRLAFAR